MYFLIHRVVLGLSAGRMCGMQVSVLGMSEQRAALEEQCAGLRRERNACKDELAQEQTPASQSPKKNSRVLP